MEMYKQIVCREQMSITKKFILIYRKGLVLGIVGVKAFMMKAIAATKIAIKENWISAKYLAHYNKFSYYVILCKLTNGDEGSRTPVLNVMHICFYMFSLICTTTL